MLETISLERSAKKPKTQIKNLQDLFHQYEEYEALKGIGHSCSEYHQIPILWREQVDWLFQTASVARTEVTEQQREAFESVAAAHIA